MINLFSLKIVDEKLEKDYNKTILTKAYESQFHVLVVFLLAFVSSVTYFLVIYSRSEENGPTARYRIYADLLRFGVYLIIIGLSTKSNTVKAYGACFMVIFFSIVLTELYILMGDSQKVFIRYGFFCFMMTE